MCRTSPSRDKVDGGTARRASCSPVSPWHLSISVLRWKSSQLSSDSRSPATRGGLARVTSGTVHVTGHILLPPATIRNGIPPPPRGPGRPRDHQVTASSPLPCQGGGTGGMGRRGGGRGASGP